jgi:hypothetical protein
MLITLLGREHPARAGAEQLVRDVYAAAYQARIASFPPLLVAALDDSGRPRCAAGLRTADTGFFSEHYLDAPVEASISACAREPVARSQVLEVTTLAGVEPGLALDVVAFVIAHGRARGMRWGMCTATEPLRRALARAGLALHVLAPAVADRVPDPAQWGSYYRTRPRVCAIADPPCTLVPRSARRPRVPGHGAGAAAVA